MAKTYCRCQGMRGAATRRGGNGGVHVSAQSYDGSVIVRNWYNEKNDLVVEIGTNDGSSCYIGNESFRGSIDEFNALLRLAKQIKSGEVSVVHHRKVVD